MLVLSRREEESLIIRLPSGKEIKVAVLELRGSHTRIGIASPNSVGIVREELLKESDQKLNKKGRQSD